MADKEVWITFAKGRPLPGCSIDFDNCEFYFVDVFIPVDKGLRIDFTELTSTVQSVLSSARVELADIGQLIRYQSGQWSVKIDDENEIEECVKKALETNKPCNGGYRSQEVQDLTDYLHVISEREWED